MARKSRRGSDETEVRSTFSGAEIYRTAVYVRLSLENSGKEDDGQSIENQKQICREYISEHKELQL